ncbi:hypothetical protein NA56DRAFT_88358 [Hyaloscypha hepaticicola]|uniref:Uncharacterized protein n=1 Tax=Hyaloscypha hepaticicola TaxID=2082293 RepID=A0A2J6Q889_9HELO|nr:hypothetical protein NA56DRAFT_88358 [Hyaloscypha hepaticicola]
MASSSSQGSEPSSGFVLPLTEDWGIREYPPRIVADSEVIVPLQTFSAIRSDMPGHPSAAYEALIRRLNDPSANGNMGVKICVRFGCLQSRLRNQTYVGNRTFASENSSGRNVQTSAREIVGQLIASMGDSLSEYDFFLQSQNLSMNYSSLRPFRKSPLCKFLLEGPPIQGNFEDPRWVLYSHAVKRLLMDPKNRNWLEQDMDIFLAAAGLITEVERDDGPPDMLRAPGLPFGGESRGGEHAGEHPIQALSSWRSIIRLIVDKLFKSIAMVVCILNVTAALGYLILMNDPAPPKSSYIIGTLLTWFLTTAMMIGYGSFTMGSIKDYARRLLILAIFTCFVVAVVFHFAGASNFASSFLVGITMAILLIQIW